MKRKRRRHVVWGIQLRITARSSRLVHGDLVDLVQTSEVDLVQLALSRTSKSANLILQLLLFQHPRLQLQTLPSLSQHL